MNRFFTLLLAASCSTAVGQSCCDQDSPFFQGGICFANGEVLGWAVDGAVCDPDCTDFNVCNPGSQCYNPSDPSCPFLAGCTESSACNYDSTALVDDGSCIYPNSPCDDGDDMTINDVVGYDCNCSGVIGVSVTFTVDMNLISQVSDQGVYIAGSFQGWDAESTMLTDNGDGTWSTTLDVLPGYHEFKFINGMGWNGGEEQMFGTPCSGDYGNRGAEFDAENNTYEACFNICPEDPCIPDPPPAYITFQIDASESDLSGESIFLFGTFTGWQGGAIEMADNGDGTWQTTQLISGGANVDYLYSIGYPVGENEETGWYLTGVDSLGLDSTNFEAAGCGVPNGFGEFNRRFIRSGEDEVIPLHCFNSCAGCNGEGCTDPTACNYDSSATLEDGTCSWNDECGVCGGQGIAEGDCDCDGNQVDAVGVCGGGCLSDYDGNGVCDALEAYGCTYEGANNFDPQATSDDGSCVFPCVGEVNANVFDWDGDYSVTVTDFLMMLTVFGDVDVDFDGVWDSADECIDTEACNYDADPSEPCQYIDVLGVCGGGCPEDADADGVCDDVDDCIGVVDECGVCNGPGATEVVIEDITILYDSVYLPQLDEWYVYEFGADTTFAYTCSPVFNACGDPINYQGYDYETVLIGEQCWFAENCRYLPEVSGSYSVVDSIPIAFVYNYFGTNVDSAMMSESYIERGALYNHFAVSGWDLCPSGWHVPTFSDFNVLVETVDTSGFSVYELKSEGDNVSGNGLWEYPNECGNNAFDFNFLPTGYVNAEGHDWHNKIGFIRSSTINSAGLPWVFDLHHAFCEGYGYIGGRGLHNGFAVRCIKDTE